MKKRKRTAKPPAKKPVLSVVEQLRVLKLPGLAETTEHTIASGIGAIQIIGGVRKMPDQSGETSMNNEQQEMLRMCCNFGGVAGSLKRP